MRGLIELKLLWLGLATVAAYTPGWLGLAVVGSQLLVLLYAAMPLQRVTVVGVVFLLGFTVLLSGIDAAGGTHDIHQAVSWFIVGACYLALYEYIALYELSAAMEDYHAPAVVVGILNFGVRFIPISIESTREALLGAKARGGLSLGHRSTLGAMSTAVFVRLLHKFEDMWISYNIRQTRTRRFHIKLQLSDYLFMLFSVVLAVLLVKL